MAHASPSAQDPRQNPASPKIFTVPPYQPFLDAVARGVLDETGGDPLKLSDYTLLVPDHETALALRQAFMEQSQGKPGILPRIDTPGDMGDESLSLKISSDPLLSQALMDIPPPASRLERQLVLAQEILKIPGMASSPQKAIKLGGELGKFLDEVERHNVELKDIERLVPPEFKNQWSKTAEFLKIVTETWPKKLQETGRVDPEAHRGLMIEIRAAHWQRKKPQHPVIAVGFNDATPSVGMLLQAVADLPQGKVVLQGLDRELDPKSWEALTPVHPQYALKEILKFLGAERAHVQEWQAQPLAVDSFARAPNLTRTNQERQKLLREATRPAGTSEGWVLPASVEPKRKTAPRKKTAADDNGIDVQALSGMDLITCTSQQEEASVIALKMRESLEIAGRKVMLVTPDRALARRVSARLLNWQIDVKDDAGTPLSETPVGVYLLATAGLAAEQWAPVAMLEALKHPLTALGGKEEETRRKVAEMENMALHGPRPAPGAAGVKGALTAAFNRAARRDPLDATLETQRKEMEGFVAGVEMAGGPFFDLMAAEKPVPFRTLLDAHLRFAEVLAKSDVKSGAERLWRGDDGVKAARFLSELRQAASRVPDVTGPEYVDVLRGLMKDVMTHSTAPKHPTLRITTPEAARLLKSDIVILGGVNDGAWPHKADENPWLSPDMIRALNLPAPEKSIGLSAHAFVQMVSNPNVLLTRSLRADDAPTVASPFLTRLMMVLRGAGLEKSIEKKTHLLDIHVAMHTPAKVTPVDPPAPTPPAEARPKELPVTAIEALMRDPYSVYVKYVLKIRPKAPLDANPNMAERGTFTHAALEVFMKKYPDALPDNAEEELLKIGRETFKERMNNPSVEAFWWPRFERVAKWFVKFEAERRQLSKTLGTEVRGRLEFDTGDGVFTLTAIADRVDRESSDQLTIIDYKTGSIPSQKSVGLGFSPQLTLEALIAFTGGFDGVDAADVGQLQYWKLSGGRQPADVTDVKGDVKELVTEARQGLENLIRTFNDKSTPYLSTPRPEWAPRYNNTRHLSRVDEWSSVKKTGGKRATPGKRRAK